MKLEIVGILNHTKKKTQLEVMINKQVQTMIVSSPLLAAACLLTLDSNFKERLLQDIPLQADAVIQGNEIKKMTRL